MKRRASIIVFAVLSVAIAIIYSYQILSGAIEPRLASWIIFGIGAVLSLASYLASDGEHSAVNNMANIADIFAISVIITILIATGARLEFNVFDRNCLIGSGAIMLIWVITRNHTAANLLLQVLMIVGYFPMLRTLWLSSHNTESFLMWGTALVSMSIALRTALRNRSIDPLPVVYAARAVIFVGILLILMLRAELS